MESSTIVEAKAGTLLPAEADSSGSNGGPVDQTLGGSPTIEPEKVLKKRDPWLDNARLVAAVLIVIMHFSADLKPHSDSVSLLYYATWPMRVPLYVLVAGYFSSDVPLKGKRAIALLRNVLFVYIIFHVLSSLQAGLTTGWWSFDVARPTFALWFLLALFFWRLTLPLLANLRFLLPVAFIVSIIAGFFPSAGHDFTASRALALWPIFIIGWKLKQYGIHRLLDRLWVKVLGLVVIVLIFVGVHTFYSTVTSRPINMRGPYRGNFLEQLGDAGFRLGLLVVALAGALALLAVLPRRKIWLVSYLGTGSLYIYLLHPFILRQIKTVDYIGWVDSRVNLAIFLLLVTLMALMLGSKPVRFATRWLVQPRYTWVFRKSPESADQRR